MSIVRLKEREYSISRLQHLKAKHPEVEEILSFMEKVLRWQLDLYEKLENNGESNWRKGLKEFYSLLELCKTYGSETLRETAQSLMALGKEEIEKLIAKFLKERWAPEEERFIFLSFLNPFFSIMAESTDADLKNWLKEKCPVCGFRPSVSYIMDTEDVEGGRYLGCVLCNTGWLYYRTKCPKCGNVEDDHFEYIHEEGNRYVQLHVCKKCNTYLKVIDLRVDGLAVPQIDDLATLSLDLWARQQGFERYEKNLLGL
jgi:FdhE protein